MRQYGPPGVTASAWLPQVRHGESRVREYEEGFTVTVALRQAGRGTPGVKSDEYYSCRWKKYIYKVLLRSQFVLKVRDRLLLVFFFYTYDYSRVTFVFHVPTIVYLFIYSLIQHRLTMDFSPHARLTFTINKTYILANYEFQERE